MAIEYKGKYVSDIPYYINLPQAENKERYRFMGMFFDFIYRLFPKHSFVVMVGFLALMVALIILANYAYLHYLTKEKCTDRTAIQIASLAGPFYGSMYIPGIHEFFYKKSFPSFSWHSPTQLVMLFASVLALLFFIKMYEKSDEYVSVKYWILTMLFGALSSYAKPSFILNMITGMIVIFLVDLFKTSADKRAERFKRLVIMGTSLIPAGCCILLVIKSTFRGNDHSHRAGVDMTFENILNNDHLLMAVISGLALPIIVWAVNYKLIGTKRYSMPFMIFVMGILQWAPFVETGARASHGNFSWGKEAGCYFLFLTSLAIAINNWYDRENFMKDKPIARNIYFAVISILFVWHIGSQLVYFYLVYSGRSFYI
jgi:uncharacterized membrane protein YidH (DUF202 family)